LGTTEDVDKSLSESDSTMIDIPPFGTVIDNEEHVDGRLTDTAP
jgi:hypothetical protein